MHVRSSRVPELIKNRGIGFGIENLPGIARGEGSYLFDDNGRRYLDGSGGPAAFCIGHGNREVNAAIAAQLEKVACGYRYLFTRSAPAADWSAPRAARKRSSRR